MPPERPDAPRRPEPKAPATLLAIAAVAAAAWIALRAAPASWVDGPWADHALPLLTRLARPALVLLPVSLTATTLVAAIVLLLLLGARGGWRHRGALVLAAVALAGATFEASWGVAYRRSPLEARLELPAGAPSADDLAAATAWMTTVASESAPTDPASLDRGAPWPEDSWAHAAACVANADAIVADRPTPLPIPATVRRLPNGLLLTGGFAGVIGPWWREPHVDGALPPTSARATALHELAHAAGWAREAETDALAVLAGLRCDASAVRFAAAVQALALLRAEALRSDPLATLALPVPAAVERADAALRSALDAHARPGVRRAVGATYDAYLRAQGVDAGMADYGRAGVLVTAALARCARSDAALLCPDP